MRVEKQQSLIQLGLVARTRCVRLIKIVMGDKNVRAVVAYGVGGTR